MGLATSDLPAAATIRQDPRPELTRSAWILADEGHESGLAGQLTARGPDAGTFWTLPIDAVEARCARDFLRTDRIMNITFDAWVRKTERRRGAARPRG